METAGEGGAWGIALLAAYMINGNENESLGDYLNNKIFANEKAETMNPDPKDVEGFNEFMNRYKAGLLIEKSCY